MGRSLESLQLICLKPSADSAFGAVGSASDLTPKRKHVKSDAFYVVNQ
jgi:hypothetical protein